MRDLQRHVRWEDDVHFDDDFRSGMISSGRLYVDDPVIMRHGEVGHSLEEIGTRRFPRDQLTLVQNSFRPGSKHDKGDENSTNGVENGCVQFIGEDPHAHSDAVEENVVPVVLCEDWKLIRKLLFTEFENCGYSKFCKF